MNSFYGKLGQKIEGDTRIIDEEEFEGIITEAAIEDKKRSKDID